MVQNLSVQVENCPTLEQYTEIENRFRKYVTHDVFMSLQDKITDFIGREEFAVLKHESDQTLKNVNKLITKEEVITRFNLLNDSISKKLADRPTIGYFKKVIAAIDKKIDAMDDTVQYQIELAEQTTDDFGKELKSFATQMDNIEKALALKIELPALDPLWKHFERFSLYDDLKTLYGKVIPEIAKFEQKIINFNTTIEKNHLIIREFDNSMSQKVNKVTLQEFQHYAETTFARKTDSQTYLDKFFKDIAWIKEQSVKNTQTLVDFNSDLDRRILKEVHHATQKFKKS